MEAQLAKRGGRGGGRSSSRRAKRAEMCSSKPTSTAPFSAFINSYATPRGQHDMRVFVMAARNLAKTGKISEVNANISYWAH